MGKRTKGPGLVSRIRACFQKSDDQKQPSQQAPGQDQQTSNDQKQPSQQAPGQDQQTSNDQKQQLQWTLEQTQLRYNELQDKHSKQMDLAARLLGLCTISGFTTFLSKSTWDAISGGTRVALECSIYFSLGVVFVVVVVINGFSIWSSYRDKHLQDIVEQDQEQSTEEKTTSLIETLSNEIEVLRQSNFCAAIALYLLYLAYAASLELLVLVIVYSH